MAGTPSLVTLTGYLGRNPEMRSTAERTYEALFYNEVAEMHEPYQVHVPSREYLVLSLARHHGAEAIWHRLVVWNGDQLCHRNIRFAGSGDLVEVVARPDSFKVGEPGSERVIQQFVVQSFRTLRRSSKRRPPEIP
jgi:hypothetical protein